jgi:hypothetical protein
MARRTNGENSGLGGLATEPTSCIEQPEISGQIVSAINPCCGLQALDPPAPWQHRRPAPGGAAPASCHPCTISLVSRILIISAMSMKAEPPAPRWEIADMHRFFIKGLAIAIVVCMYSLGMGATAPAAAHGWHCAWMRGHSHPGACRRRRSRGRWGRRRVRRGRW